MCSILHGVYNVSWNGYYYTYNNLNTGICIEYEKRLYAWFVGRPAIRRARGYNSRGSGDAGVRQFTGLCDAVNVIKLRCEPSPQWPSRNGRLSRPDPNG